MGGPDRPIQKSSDQLVTLCACAVQGSDCWLQQMSQNNDLFSLAQLLQSTQVLPNSVQEKSTLFLPTNAGGHMLGHILSSVP